MGNQSTQSGASWVRIPRGQKPQTHRNQNHKSEFWSQVRSGFWEVKWKQGGSQLFRQLPVPVGQSAALGLCQWGVRGKASNWGWASWARHQQAAKWRVAGWLFLLTRVRGLWVVISSVYTGDLLWLVIHVAAVKQTPNIDRQSHYRPQLTLIQQIQIRISCTDANHSL